VVFGVVAVWHSLQSTGSPGEIPGHLYRSLNRGRRKHLCSICKQNQFWLGGAAEPDSGVFGLEAGEDVKCESGDHFCFLAVCENIDLAFIIWNLSRWLTKRVKAILFIKVYSKIS